MQLIEMFDRGAALDPERDCFVSADGTRHQSYRATGELSHRIAVALARDGVREETKVGVLSPNDPVAFTCILGALRANASWVALNARSTAADLADLLELVGCEVLLYHASMVAAAERIAAAVPTLRLLIAIGEGGRAGDPVLDAWMGAPGARAPRVLDRPDHVAMILGTGGTTGRPKAVQLPHRTLWLMSLAFAAHMPEERPVQLMAAPMSHAAGGITFPILAAGGTTVVHTAVDPQEIFASIERHRVTRMFLPPTAIYALLAHPDVRNHDYSSLRYFIYAAAPMSVEKLREAMDVFGPVMTQTFGQAEAPMICTFFGPDEHAEALADPRLEHRLASCGRSSLTATVEIMGEDGALLGPGEKGEIVVRTDMMMRGYLDDPEQTAAVRKHGWHGTGDIGYKDADGFVYIVDRLRDMIITGGFNVFPSEVEQVIWAQPGVNDCAVIGVPDAKWGEAVTAVVEPRDGAEIDADELIAVCKERLGSVKAPKSVIVRELPRSPVGKVLKRELRDEYWAGRARAV